MNRKEESATHVLLSILGLGLLLMVAPVAVASAILLTDPGRVPGDVRGIVAVTAALVTEVIVGFVATRIMIKRAETKEIP